METVSSLSLIRAARSSSPNGETPRRHLAAEGTAIRALIPAWCENNAVDHVIGVARSDRLVGRIKPELLAAPVRWPGNWANRLLFVVPYRVLGPSTISPALVSLQKQALLAS